MTTCETVVEGLFSMLWDVPVLVLSIKDGRPATDEYAVLNARNENVWIIHKREGKENIDGKKNAQVIVCRSNNTDWGISFNRAINAILYVRGNGTITAVVQDWGSAKLMRYPVKEFWTYHHRQIDSPTDSHKLKRTTIHTQKKEDIQDTIQDTRKEWILTEPIVCLARNMLNERRTVTARWWSPSSKSQYEQVHGIKISLTQWCGREGGKVES